MAETLRKVSDGEVTFNELVEWLRSTSSQNFNDSCFKELKSDFAINFLNHIRNCSAWLVSTKYVSTVSSDTISLSSSSPEVQQKQKFSTRIKKNVAIKDATPKRKKHKDRVVLSVSMGCESYENIRRNKYANNSNAKITLQHNKGKLSSENYEGFVNVNNCNDFPTFGSSKQWNSDPISSPFKIDSRDRLSTSDGKAGNHRSRYCDVSTPQNKPHNTAKRIQPNSQICNFTSDVLSDKSLNFKNFPKIDNCTLLQRRIQPVSSDNLSIQPFAQTLLNSSNCGVSYIEPDPALVQSKQRLFLFEKIYNVLVSCGFVPNVSSELHFLFQLLTAAVDTKSLVSPGHVLSTIHNCVHFAVTALLEHRYLLTLLDNATLVLLCDVPFLKAFSPELFQFIVAHTNEKAIVRLKKKSCINVVSYDEETDTRPNHLPKEFNSLSKQRNLFYDILYMWEMEKDQVAFEDAFRERFTKSVQLLVDLGKETDNCYCLAHIFYKQLVISCLYDAETSDGYDRKAVNCENSAFNSSKLSAFAQTHDSCSGPQFHGLQAFFEAFLVSASSVHLNGFLLLLFESEIVKLNNPDNFLDVDKHSTEDIREKFSITLHTLRLLAKFYGFITFMPYRRSKPLSKQAQNIHKLCRDYVKETLGVAEMLNIAISKRSLIITVPWVVEYLMMMNQVGSTSEQYLNICKTLVKIYRGHFRLYASPINYEFIRLAIGKFMEMSVFPLECFFQDYEPPEKNEIEITGKHLDFQDVVDKQLAYSCCPDLAELKSFIDNFFSGVDEKDPDTSKTFSKSPTLWRESDEFTHEQRQEAELEENFFISHPPFLKNTVTLVSERIASGIICHVIKKMKELKAEAIKRISSVVREQLTKELDIICDLAAVESRNICSDAKRWALESLKEANVENGTGPSLRAAQTILPALLFEEVDPAVIDMSCRIASDMVIRQVTKWINSNIVPEKVKVSIKNKVQLSGKDNDLMPSMPNTKEKPSLKSMKQFPFEYGRTLQYMRLQLDSEPSSISMTEFLDFFGEIASVIQVNYLTSFMIQAITAAVIDIVTTLIVNFPKKCTIEFVERSVYLLSLCPPKLVLPSRFLNFGILYSLSLAKDTLSWDKFAVLFDCALKSKLFSPEDFNRCVSEVISYPCTEDFLQSFVHFLQTVSCKNESFTDFSYLMHSVR